MKSAVLVMLAALCITTAGVVQADFYRYVDQHGNVIFTDDLSKVPPDQREKVQSYEESTSTVTPDTLRKPDDPAGNTTAQLENERQKLEQREKDLNKEYEDLMAERTQLENQKKEATSSEKIKRYNEQIVQFNSRIQAYEEKRDAYTVDIRNFNERLEALQAEAKKKPQ